MAEKEQGSRHIVEQRASWVSGWLQVFGQLGALALSLYAIYAGYHLLVDGKSLAGFTFFIAAVATLVGTAMYRHKHANQPPR
ncbi:MAG TPA: hypothetical protein VHD62_10530 [Opitutaceae bacterium]|nr:hypothetical protein [Opitutaceae bacterium]